MAKLKVKEKTYKFKERPLYHTGKTMDLSVQQENLKLIYEFSAEYGIKPFLLFGTLLGAVRDGGFIPHDEDMDLGVSEAEFDVLLYHLDVLLEKDFVILRYDERGMISLARKGEYLDISYFEFLRDKAISCNIYLYPLEFVRELKPVKFLDFSVYVPDMAEEMLLYEYGETWITPIKYADENKNHFSDRLKGFVKIILPTRIKLWLLEKWARPLKREYSAKFDTYRKREK